VYPGGYRREPIVAVNELTLEVPSGQIFGLVGPNGSGKTTTLKLLLGLLFPTSGTGEVLGHPLGSPAYKPRVGYVPDGPYFYEYLNAPELLRFYGRLFGMSGAALEKRVDELLELVRMSGRKDLRVAEYSKGMRQRVGVAQALLNDPDLVFLDEPTTGLDPMGAVEMRNIALELRSRGKTVFLCSHLLKDMEPMCDSIAILDFGRIIRSGMVDELLIHRGEFVVRARGVSEDVKQRLAPLVLSAEASAALRPIGPAAPAADEGAILVHADSQDRGLEIARLIAEGGGTVLEVAPARESLEEYFMRAVDYRAGD